MDVSLCGGKRTPRGEQNKRGAGRRNVGGINRPRPLFETTFHECLVCAIMETQQAIIAIQCIVVLKSKVAFTLLFSSFFFLLSSHSLQHQLTFTSLFSWWVWVSCFWNVFWALDQIKQEQPDNLAWSSNIMGGGGVFWPKTVRTNENSAIIIYGALHHFRSRRKESIAVLSAATVIWLIYSREENGDKSRAVIWCERYTLAQTQPGDLQMYLRGHPVKVEFVLVTQVSLNVWNLTHCLYIHALNDWCRHNVHCLMHLYQTLKVGTSTDSLSWCTD